MGFQTAVNRYNPIGVEGDFASANPRASAYASESGLVAGPQGVTVGRFAWIEADGRTVNNYGDGATAPHGYVSRRQGSALITVYLAEESNLIPAGFPVNLLVQGDFLITVRGEASFNGAEVFASYADGTPWIGSAPTGTTATGSIGATFTATGAVVADVNQITTSAVTGLISEGDGLAGTGIPAGTFITGQLSGTTGGAGVYTVSGPTTIAAATGTSFGDVLDVTATVGVLAVGDAITGTGVPAGATIASQVSGVGGGVGVYTINVPATAYADSTALTTVGGVLTKWTARNAQPVGNTAAMSSW
jgi:hypothetical protein